MKALAITTVALLALSALVLHVVRGGGALPDRPTPIAWDREVCGYCRMHVGEPRHAVQLVTGDGDVVNFDDVGCALRYLSERPEPVHRLWFHGDGDTWMTADQVGFVPAPTTPMGSGLVAVDARTPGARSLAQLRRDPVPR
jgi:hypothetical protein